MRKLNLLRIKASSEYCIRVNEAENSSVKADIAISLPYRFEEGDGHALIHMVDEHGNTRGIIEIDFPSPGSNMRSILYEIMDATRGKISEMVFDLFMFCDTESAWAEPDAKIEAPAPDLITICCTNGASFSFQKPA